MNRLYMTLFTCLSLASGFAYSAIPQFDEATRSFISNEIAFAVVTTSVIAIDVDGDGDIDVVTANGTNDDSISWFDNDGSQNFVRKDIDSNLRAAASVFAIDVDGDGDIDVLSANAGAENTITWHENDGEENFSRNTIALATGASSVFALDVDGDGDIDVVSASSTTNSIMWHENNGSESFTNRQIAGDVASARSVFAIDVDGDSDIDVLTAGSGDNTITWFENDGSQNFTRNDIATDLNNPRSVYAIDIDGDDDLDVFSGSFDDNTVVWFENDGAENFTRNDITSDAQGPGAVFATDIDGDSDLDLLVASRHDNLVSWFENDGNQAFTRNITSTVFSAVSVFAIDLDGDGDNDVVPGGNSGSLTWFENALTYSFSVDENTLDVGTTVAADALSYSLSSSDSALFAIDSTGKITFNEAPDFEDPVDVGADNIYAIIVTASANDGQVSAEVTITVTDDNDAPIISGTPDSEVAQDNLYTFTPTSSDLENDELIFDIVNRPSWAAFSRVDGTLSGTPGNFDVGVAEGIIISVRDASLTSTLPAFNITVTNINDAPIIQGAPTTTIAQNNLYNFTPNSSDPDGDALTFSIVNQPSWTSFSTSTGLLTGTPGNANVGVTEGIVISITDGELSADLPAFNLTVTNVNDAPTISGTPIGEVAQGASYSFIPDGNDIDGDNLSFSIASKPAWASFSAENGALTGIPGNSDVGLTAGIVITVTDGVASASLPNFSLRVTNVNDAPIISGSPNGEVAQGSLYTFTPAASDVDGDELIFDIVNRPSWAAFSRVDGTLSGTPGNANVGVAEGIIISVRDASLTSTLPAFNITVTNINDAPIILGAPTTTIAQNNLYNFTPNSSDPDGDSLTFSIVNQPSWTSFSASTGLLSGTPGNSDVGVTEGIVISITDGELSADLPAFNLTVTNVNDAPTISGTPIGEVAQGLSYSFIPDGNDIDGDNLSFSIASKPAWAIFSAETGALTGIPGNSDVGLTAGIVITITDGVASASLPAFSLRVTNVNDAPTISGSPNSEVAQDSLYTFTPASSDVDGDELIFDIVNRPSWATFSRVDGTLSGTPGNLDVGVTEGIVISVRDAILTSILPAFNITVTNINDVPIILGTPTTTVAQNNLYNFTPNSSDPDGDALTFSIVNQPSWTSFSTSTGLLSGTPGNANVGVTEGIVISISDGELSANLLAFNLTVTNVNDAPTISGTPNGEVAQGATYSFTPASSDVDGDELIFDIVNRPSWAAFSSVDGTLSGTPGNANVGVTEGIVISVRDAILTSTLPAFNITVTNVNDAPVAEDINVSVEEDNGITIVSIISDVDELDELSVSIAEPPTNGTVNVSGKDFFYQPNENFNGIDTFTYLVTDIDLLTGSAIVTISVEAENDQPLANDDEFLLQNNSSGIYTLSVLNNDIDVDGDTLTIDSADSEFGQLSIVANELVLDVGSGFIGNINLAYILRDNVGGRDNAKVSLKIEGEIDPDSPQVTVPPDLVVFATGRLSKIIVGIATAVDSITGKALPVQLENSDSFLAPGVHNLVWSATNEAELKSFGTQRVDVIPKISSSLNDIVSEGNIATIEVSLNGKSPSYPVIVPYTISGTAEPGIDHDGQSGELVINSGTRGILNINVFEDSLDDDDESIIFSLSDTLNLAQSSTTQITISDANLPPRVTLEVEQNGEKRRIIAKDQGLVTITASVIDKNINDVLTVTWSASEGVTSTFESTDSFTFEPAALTSSIVTLSLNATDDGTPALAGTDELILSIVESLTELTGGDADNDRIPDILEGYSDDNANGIANYLDAIDDCHVIPQTVNERVLFLIEGDFGACIARGKLATLSSNGATQLTEEDVSENLTADPEAKIMGGTVDFIINGLQIQGQTYQVVVPQLRPIPANGFYRKYHNDNWVNFVVDENNAIYSAKGDRGVCPPPGDSTYMTGLTVGHWCVQLRIQDGGPNDTDNTANGAISDPGGVATNNLTNTLPMALNDRFNVRISNSTVLAVLRNDEDADGDLLEVIIANASFGQVSINSDNTLTYTPPIDFVGEDIITYVISDNAGGTDDATVIVNVAVNHAPLAVSDNATTDSETAIVINVTNNDTDIEGDQLFVGSVLAALGTAELSGSDSVLYTPPAGFVGTDTLTYTVEDGNGGISEGTVVVVVTAHVPSSGRGSLSYIWISLLMFIWLGRLVKLRRKIN